MFNIIFGLVKGTATNQVEWKIEARIKHLDVRENQRKRAVSIRNRTPEYFEFVEWTLNTFYKKY